MLLERTTTPMAVSCCLAVDNQESRTYSSKCGQLIALLHSPSMKIKTQAMEDCRLPHAAKSTMDHTIESAVLLLDAGEGPAPSPRLLADLADPSDVLATNKDAPTAVAAAGSVKIFAPKAHRHEMLLPATCPTTSQSSCCWPQLRDDAPSPPCTPHTMERLQLFLLKKLLFVRVG